MKYGEVVELATVEVDLCPIHGDEIRREYDFGMQDATVYVYECRCAACATGDHIVGSYTLCRTYNDAAGIAKMQKAMNAVKYR